MKPEDKAALKIFFISLLIFCILFYVLDTLILDGNWGSWGWARTVLPGIFSIVPLIIWQNYLKKRNEKNHQEGD